MNYLICRDKSFQWESILIHIYTYIYYIYSTHIEIFHELSEQSEICILTQFYQGLIGFREVKLKIEFYPSLCWRSLVIGKSSYLNVSKKPHKNPPRLIFSFSDYAPACLGNPKQRIGRKLEDSATWTSSSSKFKFSSTPGNPMR